MNYELAKKLKDAGFPQSGWNVIEPTERERSEGRITVKYPLLDDLVEALQNKDFSLCHYPPGDWFAYVRREKFPKNMEAGGANAVEAVANLYIFLAEQNEI